MKNPLLIVLLVISLVACSALKPHEKESEQQAQQAGLVVLAKSHLDATYVLPHAQWGHYKKIILDDLDLSSVNIINPNSYSIHRTPWELNDRDRAYYQEKYVSAANEQLFAKGYTAATTAGADTLLLKARITEIAPLAPKDDLKGRPTIMDVYSEGFGRMTIVFEVYDSVSNKLLLITSDEHDLGRFWEKNTRAQNNMQIRSAFDFWLRYLKKDLDKAAKK